MKLAKVSGHVAVADSCPTGSARRSSPVLADPSGTPPLLAQRGDWRYPTTGPSRDSRPEVKRAVKLERPNIMSVRNGWSKRSTPPNLRLAEQRRALETRPASGFCPAQTRGQPRLAAHPLRSRPPPFDATRDRFKVVREPLNGAAPPLASKSSGVPLPRLPPRATATMCQPSSGPGGEEAKLLLAQHVRDLRSARPCGLHPVCLVRRVGASPVMRPEACKPKASARYREELAPGG